MARTMSGTMNDKPLAVVLLSGGLDSMVCAALAREAGFRVLALTVDYNTSPMSPAIAQLADRISCRWI
jgi:7-cyano-7-deazaguanine synthase in queuosine biosynthesis